MELYFSPLACSVATRIILYETGLDCDYREVDLGAKRTKDGEDFVEISPLGYVPVLRTDDGRLITENTAVLQYAARLAHGSSLAPQKEPEISLLQEWLGFISTELHKGIFSLLFSRDADDAVKAFAMKKADSRFAYVDQRLEGRETLLDQFSVADAYLITAINWVQATPISLDPYKEIRRYRKAVGQRPSVARAFADELPLYRAQNS